MDNGIRSLTVPAPGGAWGPWGVALDVDVRALVESGFHLDQYTGTDDEKLTAAIADSKAATDRNMPAVVLPSRPMTFTTPRQMYSGLKVIGARPQGQKNPEIAGGNYVGPEIMLGGSVGTGANSLWHNNAGSTLYNVFMSDFSVQGSQGSAAHQFIDNTSGNLYACAFNSLSFNFMRSVFGDYSLGRKCLVTQVALTGNWTINNAWKNAAFFGGSDINFSPDMMNIGVSQSAAQTGSLSTYFLVLDSIETKIGGKVYISTMNGWRGLLISGNSNVAMFEGVFEGFKPTRTNGLLAGPGPGSQIKITNGAVTMFGTKIGQGMDNPDPTESALVEISGGEVNMNGLNFYGNNLGTVNAINHTGGRLSVFGILKRTDSVWTNRPLVKTTASPGEGTYTYCCPDFSMKVA